ncbi:TetR/AcrR family transcriptional regulator [Paenibacillus whitsoniae]|uniref:TetR/AcrR family transcriptional regulator n=1 Tax=Paenibacillus whitsoniae TaxID=2496558 RepID=A0A430JBQ4_9BACL|nr:TetR/AcrR family transcriptional regulator [Paenibacillus whitsoniae]RTE08451.1 TetR/AcrR family transcriptional regulator [Paenibacillus whitsoniae]
MKKTKPSNRDVVLRTAMTLFLTRGYLTTSIDDIVAASKVAKTNIYYYFKSKDELLAAILDGLIAAYNEKMQDIFARQELKVYERFALFLKEVATPEDSSLAGCPFLTLYTQLPPEAEPLRRKVGAFFEAQTAAVEAMLHEGIRNGEFAAQLPVPAVAGLIVSTIEGALFLQHARQNPALLEQTLITLALLLK